MLVQNIDFKQFAAERYWNSLIWMCDYTVEVEQSDLSLCFTWWIIYFTPPCMLQELSRSFLSVTDGTYLDVIVVTVQQIRFFLFFLCCFCTCIWFHPWNCESLCCWLGKSNRQGAKNRHRTERTNSQSGACKTPPREHRQRHQSTSEQTKSPSSERGPKKNSVDLRARYWKFLFDNFQRAVDGIYQTCEQDESVVECKVCNGIVCNSLWRNVILHTMEISS